MRIAFFHSHKFRKTEMGYASTGGLSESVLARYIENDDELYVYGRIAQAQAGEKLSHIRDPRIHITAYDSVNLGHEIKKSDFCIMRLPSPIGVKACICARKLHIPYLVEVVGRAWDSYWNHSLLGKIVAFPAEILARYCIGRAQYTTYVTQKYLQEAYPSHGQSIGVSDIDILSLDDSIINQRICRIKKRCPILKLGTVGAIDVSYKSQETVIRALAYLKSQGKTNLEYHIVGPGRPEMLQTLAETLGVANQIVIEGTLAHDQVFCFLDNIDIYIQPSKTEGLCRALLEAMGRGCPAIASDVGGNPELISPNYLFKHGNHAEKRVAELIENLDEAELCAQAKANYSTAMEYDPTVLKNRWEAFYHKFRNSIEI